MGQEFCIRDSGVSRRAKDKSGLRRCSYWEASGELGLSRSRVRPWPSPARTSPCFLTSCKINRQNIRHALRQNQMNFLRGSLLVPPDLDRMYQISQLFWETNRRLRLCRSFYCVTLTNLLPRQISLFSWDRKAGFVRKSVIEFLWIVAEFSFFK